MTTQKYWFGFRQTTPHPPGQVIACGPYTSYEQAKLERERSKAWDCEVSIPFTATTPQEADETAKRYLA